MANTPSSQCVIILVSESIQAEMEAFLILLVGVCLSLYYYARWLPSGKVCPGPRDPLPDAKPCPRPHGFKYGKETWRGHHKGTGAGQPHEGVIGSDRRSQRVARNSSNTSWRKEGASHGETCPGCPHQGARMRMVKLHSCMRCERKQLLVTVQNTLHQKSKQTATSC